MHSAGTLFHTWQKTFPPTYLIIQIFSLKFPDFQSWRCTSCDFWLYHSPLLSFPTYLYLFCPAVSVFLIFSFITCCNSAVAAVYCWWFQIWYILQSLPFETYLAGENAVDLKTRSQKNRCQEIRKKIFPKICLFKTTGRKTKDLKHHFVCLASQLG